MMDAVTTHTDDSPLAARLVLEELHYAVTSVVEWIGRIYN